MTAGLVTLGVLAALGALFVITKSLQDRCGLTPEAARKTVHLSMGLVALPLPWFFSDAIGIWILCAAAATFLLTVRLLPSMRRLFSGVLGGVSRSSLGDLFYPAGVALAFSFARGDRTAYGCGVGVLAFADTAGAMIGSRFGRRHYTLGANRKSVEGSLAVFAVSVLWISLLLGLSLKLRWEMAILAAFGIGAVAMFVEGISAHGLDNLALPIVVTALVGFADGGAADTALGGHLVNSMLIALWIATPLLLAGLTHVAVIKLGLFMSLADLPLDCGLKWGGRAWFGKNKSWRGVIVMMASTALFEFAQSRLASAWPRAGAFEPKFQWQHPWIWGTLAGAGYIAGELPNSFVKRRLGIDPGATAGGPARAILWTADQIDSMLGLLLFLSPVWIAGWPVTLALLGVTLALHPAVAWVMCLLGLKSRVG